MLDYFSAHPVAFVILAGVLGALVGSFLNVVIHRLPIMMEREWQAQCEELANPETSPRPSEPYNLAVPASSCPGCGHKIRAWENIPLLSYLLLRGKCAGCGAPISFRYPLIEAVTATLSAFVAWHFGFGWEAAAALLLTWALVPLTVIDIDHQLLPDAITLPFLWIGLGLSLFALFTPPESAILGAIVGYLALWSVYWGFKLLTGKEGMGYGDFKLLAMLGAWLGWQVLPVIILLSSLVGAVIGIGMILILGRDKSIPIPFGPYLAIAGWITLIWGQDLTQAYLHMSGLN
ncbi:MAG TPA: prepilin peptidase [Candidatus Tenderia sp.]|nr:prepilin peptidase [Candidatus Tenderia sp.]